MDSESVVFNPDPEEINIHYLTRVNNQIIYQVNTHDCIRYISIDDHIEHTGFVYKDKMHIFRLVGGEIPDEIKRYFFHINEEKINILTRKVRSSNVFAIFDILDSLKKIPNFVFIEEYKLKCIDFKDLTQVKARIEELNAALHQTCPGFSLNIDYIYRLSDPSIVSIFSLPIIDPNTLLLCLFNGNKCVSSLELDINPTIHNNIYISISSKTKRLYEKRNYNKLLRAIIIIIAKSIDPAIQYIQSSAINPVSAYLMLHSFNAVYKNFVTETKLNRDSTYEEIKAEMELLADYALITNVELNDENNAIARGVFESIIENINCEPVMESHAGIAKGKRTKVKRTRRRRGSKRKGEKGKSRTFFIR
jgi:hypothetical protein